MEKDSVNDQGKALNVARIYFQSHLQDPEANAYILTRCLSPSALRKFEIGYAPDQWRGLVDHYSSHRIRLAALEAGLLTTPAQSNRLLDLFRNRLIFPIRDHNGELVGYGGRTLSKEKDTPKYINTPETALFNKSALLYGLHQNLTTIAETGHAIVVEGYMDVIALSTAGCHNAVAPMGTAITKDQIQLLLAQGVKCLWLCLDGDAAGQSAAERSLAVIMEHYHPALEVRLIRMPAEHDPDSLVREKGLDAFRELMKEAKSLPDFIEQVSMAGGRIDSLESKASFLLRLTPYLAAAGGSLRDQLIERASTLTGLPVSELRESLLTGDNDNHVNNWHPLVALGARQLLHSDCDMSVLGRLEQFDIKGHGFAELVDLVQSKMEGDPTEGLLARFALAHGKLSSAEEEAFKREFLPWLKNQAISQNLDELVKAPFDSDAKRQVRGLLKMR